jgi:hypothetical protein
MREMLGLGCQGTCGILCMYRILKMQSSVGEMVALDVLVWCALVWIAGMSTALKYFGVHVSE